MRIASAFVSRLAVLGVLGSMCLAAEVIASPAPEDPFDLDAEPSPAPAPAPPPAPNPAPLPSDGLSPLAPESSSPTGPGPTADEDDLGGPVAPLGELPPPPPEIDPRNVWLVRTEFVFGMLWRIETTEPVVHASLEAGRLQGLSGSFHVGVIVAPDRDFVSAVDVPIGAGIVARRRFFHRPVYGSVGLDGGLLIHRAGTDIGVVHRVDPDLQLPLKFAWTPRRVGLSVVLLQGLSFRTRTYERRGVEVWRRIPYRVGLAVGLHFDIGFGPPKSRRSD